MLGLQGRHWTLIGLFVGAVCVQVAGLASGEAGDTWPGIWEHMSKPSYVAGFVGQMIVLVRAMGTTPPGEQLGDRK
jgi:hypothetical protein